jgi:hypothetical protein
MLPYLPREPEGGAMKSADGTAYEPAELAVGERLESDITDADVFLRLAATIEAAPEQVAVETARWIRQMVADAWNGAGLYAGCGGTDEKREPIRTVTQELPATRREVPINPKRCA